MHGLRAILLACLLPISSYAATNVPFEGPGSESLGGKLLDDLGPITPLPRPGIDATGTAMPGNAPHGANPLVGKSPGSKALATIGIDMQHAELLLTQPGAKSRPGTVQLAGVVQDDAVSKLDKLIAELSKQCQGGQCQGGQCPPGKKPPNPNTQPKPGKSGSAAGAGRAAARDSTDRLNSTTAKPTDKGDIKDTVKAFWGHLPERSREQMLQSFSDEFLPKYELEIEQYYRRLSEEQGEGEAPR
jgi:hypothetical protein